MKKAYRKIKPTASEPLAGINAGPVTVVNTDTGDAGDDRDYGSGDDGEGHGEAGEEEKKGEPEPEPPSPQLHPQRQAMLDGDGDGDEARRALHGTDKAGDDEPREDGSRQRQREQSNRPKRKHGYFDEALTMAERKKAETAERVAEQQRREAERQRKTEDREKFRRAMAKARKPGRDGQRRLGRESGLLLEKVKKMVA